MNHPKNSAPWVFITERYPEAGRRVLILCAYGDRRPVVIGRWQPAGTIDGQFWDDYPEEWESEDDKEITNRTDLWVEDGVEIEQCAFLENVVAWMPVPPAENDPAILCESCHKAHVRKIGAVEPWSDEHWMCPYCHGTFPIFAYPKAKSQP